MSIGLRTVLILGLAGVLFALGLLFIAAPRAGAAIFGLAAEEEETLRYVSALGFRDLGLSLGVAALALFSSPRSVGLMLGAATLIPICDFLLVISSTGLSASAPLALHAASAGSLTGLSAWSLKAGSGR